MSRRVLCEKCGNKYPNQALRIELLPKSSYGEPAEYARVIKGITKNPQPGQRTIHVNDEPFSLEPDYYNCDLCGTIIKPGDKATCVTIWMAGMPIPSVWESEFIDKDEDAEPSR